jgi:hypothetical protein
MKYSWRTLKDGTKVFCFKIPVPKNRKSSHRKFFYPVVPDSLEGEPFRRLLCKVETSTGLTGRRALVYYYARLAGWGEEKAKEIAGGEQV